MTIDEEIKMLTSRIRKDSKRLEQLFIEREKAREIANGQIHLEEVL